MVRIRIKHCVFATLLMFLSLGAFASTIVPNTTNTSVVSGDNGASDLVSLSPPNASGISVNRFDYFSVINRPVSLVNVPSYVGSNENEVFSGPAELIVIQAPTIDIQNTVTLLGPSADIVFITNNTAGDISCINCTFNNFLRISLLAGQGNVIHNEMADVGVLTSGVSAMVSLNGLYAPGALGVDVLGNIIYQTGVIDTHQRAIKDARGGYTNVAHGNLKIGSGQVNLMLGDVSWDYEAHQVVDVGDFAGARSLGGSIASTSVKITSSTDLELTVDIDTRTDLAASVTYKNGTFIPREGIEIYAFVDASVDVHSDLRSEGDITFSAVDNLELSASSSIEAKTAQLIAKGRVINHALVHAGSLSVAGRRVVNEGQLTADNALHVWAEQEVANQYGGYISGDHVILVSETRAVRNGSRTPYRSRDVETNDLLSAVQNAYVANIDARKLGTYYSLNYSPANATGVSLAASNTAHISADVLEIKAVAFENINPFYKRVSNDTYLELSREKIDQVRISAESNLSIKASSYIVNSSAQIIQNSPVGKIAIDTALFTNERYRVETIMDYSHASQTSSENLETNSELVETVVTTTTVDELIGTTTVAYSPPGSIVAMGAFENKSSQSFSNNTAYIEVFGNGIFDTPYIRDFGFENQGVAKSETSTNSTTTIDLSSIFGQNSNHVQENNYQDTETQVVDPSELDSLFYIHGDFVANADFLENDGNALFANHNPLDLFIQDALDAIVSKNKYEQIRNQDTTDVFAGEVESIVFEITTHIHSGSANLRTSDIESIKAGGEITVDWSQVKDTHSTTNGMHNSSTTEIISGSDTYSLLDELKKLFDQLVNSFNEFFDEIVWWE